MPSLEAGGSLRFSSVGDAVQANNTMAGEQIYLAFAMSPLCTFTRPAVALACPAMKCIVHAEESVMQSSLGLDHNSQTRRVLHGLRSGKVMYALGSRAVMLIGSLRRLHGANFHAREASF